ncbi:MAG: thioredoxin [Clostridia bacterium]
MSIKLTSSNFNQIVKDSSTPVLIDFYADWCGPCKMAAPIVEQIANEYGDRIKVCKVNIDQEESIARQFGVASIPTFIVIRNNKEVNRSVGLRDKQALIQMLK